MRSVITWRAVGAPDTEPFSVGPESVARAAVGTMVGVPRGTKNDLDCQSKL